MGAEIDMNLSRCGFYPAGGGELGVKIGAAEALLPLYIEERGALRQASAEALIAALPIHIAERVAGKLCRQLKGYQHSGVPVGPNLADQLLLPLVLVVLSLPASRHGTP